MVVGLGLRYGARMTIGNKIGVVFGSGSLGLARWSRVSNWSLFVASFSSSESVNGPNFF
jgi:hypothetical protein